MTIRDQRIRVSDDTHARLAKLKEAVERQAPDGVTYTFDTVINELLQHYTTHYLEQISRRYQETQTATWG